MKKILERAFSEFEFAHEAFEEKAYDILEEAALNLIQRDYRISKVRSSMGVTWIEMENGKSIYAEDDNLMTDLMELFFNLDTHMSDYRVNFSYDFTREDLTTE